MGKRIAEKTVETKQYFRIRPKGLPSERVYISYGRYETTGNMAVSLVTDYGEPYCRITYNIGSLPPLFTVINNQVWDGVMEWLIKIGAGTIRGYVGEGNNLPVFEFNPDFVFNTNPTSALDLMCSWLEEGRYKALVIKESV